MQWHQLDHMQTICTWLQTATPTPHLFIFTGRTLFLTPSQQGQRTEGKLIVIIASKNGIKCDAAKIRCSTQFVDI